MKTAKTAVDLVDKFQELKTNHLLDLKNVVSLSYPLSEMENIIYQENGEDLSHRLTEGSLQVLNSLWDIFDRDTIESIKKAAKFLEKMKNKYDVLEKQVKLE